MEYDALAERYAAHRRHDQVVLDALRSGGSVGPSSRVRLEMLEADQAEAIERKASQMPARRP